MTLGPAEAEGLLMGAAALWASLKIAEWVLRRVGK